MVHMEGLGSPATMKRSGKVVDGCQEQEIVPRWRS